MKAFIIALIVAICGHPQPVGNVYSAWTDDGIHLMISDNGTPEDFDDDFVCDWETNRDFTIIICD